MYCLDNAPSGAISRERVRNGGFSANQAGNLQPMIDPITAEARA